MGRLAQLPGPSHSVMDVVSSSFVCLLYQAKEGVAPSSRSLPFWWGAKSERLLAARLRLSSRRWVPFRIIGLWFLVFFSPKGGDYPSGGLRRTITIYKKDAQVG
jgi:hypothetical protein